MRWFTLFIFAVTGMAAVQAAGHRHESWEEFLGHCGKQHFLMPPGGEARPGRKYARDRLIDVRHLALDVTPDFKARTVAGTAVITFSPIGLPLTKVEFDAVDLTVESVALEGATLAEYQNTGEKLILNFTEPLAPDAEAKAVITYRCQPENGLYFRTPEMGYPEGDTQLWTQGEAELHRHWFPCYDYPNERFTSEILCHVPEGMEVVSNGRLIAREKGANGLVGWHWRQEEPHVNYLVALAAGYFHKLEATVGDLPLALLVPPSEKDQAALAFRDTREIIEFFQNEIGVPFPWNKYYQVYCHDFLAGGMENTSCSFMAVSALFPEEVGELDTVHRLDAHETAHQWFGDLLTCRDWSHLWLNEGFASYYTVLYEGHKNGRDDMLYSLWKEAARVLNSNDTRPIVWKDYGQPMEQFDARAYPKGAWVLHMLRSQLGAPLFQKAVRVYLDRHRNGIVTTDDLQDVMEEVSGRSLDQFFDQWTHHGGVPVLSADYSWDADTKMARVVVRQTQKVDERVPLFRFPLPVRFLVPVGEGATETKDFTVTVGKAEEAFYFHLPAKPELVRLDPDYTVLAKWNFTPPADMLRRQLKGDFIGRLLAIEILGNRKDDASVAQLADLAANDPHKMARVEATLALRKAGSEAARKALIGLLADPQEVVRRAAADSLASIYHPEVADALAKLAETEKNPVILSSVVRSFASWPERDVLPFLKVSSYHNMVAAAAVATLRVQDRQDAAPAVLNFLRRADKSMEMRDYGQALEALAFLSRERKTEATVKFLTDAVADTREPIRIAAARALGQLGDPRALPVLRGLASGAKGTLARVAEESATRIQAKQDGSEQNRAAWKQVEELLKKTGELERKLQELESKRDAR